MSIEWYIAAAALAGGVGLGAGWWRRVFAVAGIPKRQMTVARLGLHVHEPAHVARVDAILSAFADGFNTILSAPHPDAWRAKAESMPTILQPFAHEGGAMGHIPRRLFRYDPVRFEAQFPRRQPQFRYLYYVGLGFWAGMRNYSAKAMARLVDGLDPLYRYLCYDGFGFKRAFFDRPQRDDGLAALDELSGYARAAAYQGVGRALWFWYMDDLPGLAGAIRQGGDCAEHAAAGVGLAAVFTFPDRLPEVLDLMGELPAEWHRHVALGLCFGLKARATTDRGDFTAQVARLPGPRRQAIAESIEACDRIEADVRSDGLPDGYRRWREAVTQGLEQNVVFPMQATRPGAPSRVPSTAADYLQARSSS
jgi:hypothetical protein